MIPRSTIDRVLDATKIEEVVGDFVTLRKRGTSLVACCPFHNEKTPSFHVTPSRGTFKCFGCGKGGSAVTFLREHEGYTFVEAIKWLAKKYHIEVEEREESPEEMAAHRRKESLMVVVDFAASFFASQLKTPEGQVGYAYFKSRGLSDETIEKYGLGWAPGKGKFCEAARKAGFKEEFLLELGLCMKTDDGRVVDRFYDRVVFPIRNLNSRTIAFGCRTLRNDKTVAKYVNSHESEIYSKRFTLYGIDEARSAVHKEDNFILVEGYLDVLTLHQLGIRNVAASSGTALTPEQIGMIRKMTSNVTIVYDGDAAGIHAATRGTGMFLERGFNVYIVLLPDGDDPDSFGRKHSREEVEAFIRDNRKDFIGFKLELMLAEAGNDPLKRAGLVNDIADTVAMVSDAVLRNEYVRFASSQLDVQESIFASRVTRTRRRLLEEKRREMQREEQKGRTDAGGSAGGAAVEMSWPASVPDNEAQQAGEWPSEMQLPPDISEDVSLPPLAEVFRPREDAIRVCERDLLIFLLRYGDSALLFNRDSQFYVDGQEPGKVADFILDTLEEDESVMFNEDYRICYERYRALWKDGLAQLQILVRLQNDENESVRKTAADLIEERYPLTVARFESSLTNESTYLAKFVPKSLVAYNKAKIDREIDGVRRALKSPAADTDALMAQMNELNKMKLKINELLLKL